MRILRRVMLVISSLCAGCVALTSELADEGVVYHLPKSILTIAVWEYHDPETSRTWYTLGGIAPGGNPPRADGIPTEATVKISDETIPDPEHRYAIKYRPSATSDDRLCISRTTGGLLYDVQFASDDRTPEIAFNIARFLAGSVGDAKRAGFYQAPGATAIRARSYSSKVDPFNRTDIDTFNAALERTFRAPLSISFERAKEMIQPSKTTWPKGCSDNGCSQRALQQQCKPEHICYRTKLTLPIELLLNKKVVDVNYAEVINAWDIGAVSVTRAFLVHKISKFRFDKGALVAAIMRKPSEIEEASLLPIHVVNAALITPSGMWAAAFNGNNADKTALWNQMVTTTAKVAELEAQYKTILSQGTGPTINAENDIKYSIDCAAPGRGSMINVVGGGTTQF